jgi:drug/metabolite transporter (DMT)-like permease
LTILANILWGASFLASKYTLQAWGPFTASSLRFGIATIALFLVLRLLGKKIEIPFDLKQWGGLIIIATTGYGALYPLQLAGLRYISSGLSAAIMLTSSLLVLLFGKTLLSESLSIQKWLALGLGVIGGSILLLSSTGVGDLNLSSDLVFGSGFTFLSAASKTKVYS